MKNEERFRRHIGVSNVCRVCRKGVESIIHVLRDCPAMQGIWDRIIPRVKRQSFFRQSLFEWTYDNLSSSEVKTETGPWVVLFAVAIWWAWKWRCGNVFGGKRLCRDRVQFVKEQAKEINMCSAKKEAVRITRVERWIKWEKPPTGWFKVNTDGASRGNPGLATASGVLRDENGSWLCGFGLNIGRCSAPLAELWGVYYGLLIAWHKGVRCVEVEVDSAVVVGFFRTGIAETHPLSFLVRLCYGFISRDWIVRFKHIYREANGLADGLATYAFSLALGFHIFDVVPVEVSLLLIGEGSGPPKLRHVVE